MTTARERGGGVVIVEGQRGAGRTSVLHALYRHFATDARYVAVERWVRDLPMTLFERLTEISAPLVHSGLFPGFGQVVDLPVRERTAGYIAACQQVLEQWQQTSKLVVLVDDIHLADEHSQMLLSSLGRRIENTGTVMVVSVPTPTPSVIEDLDGLLQNPVSTRVGVQPLELSCIQGLAHAMGVYSLDTTALTALFEHTGGLLDYVVQTLRELPDGAWPVDPGTLPVPDRIVAEVMEPFRDCDSPDVWKLSCALAVLEHRPALQVLESIAGTDDVIFAIDAAVAQGVVQDGVLREAYNTDQWQLDFVHPMAAEVIVRQMLPSEHRGYHLRAAEWSESHGQRLFHRAAATLTRDAVLGGEIIRYAERLERTGRWDDAARFRFAAARLMSSHAQRQHEVLNGVDALASAGRITAAAPWLPALEAMHPSAGREVVLANVALHQGRAADAGHLLRQAGRGGSSDPVQSVVALRLCLDKLCRWDAAGVLAWTQRAVELSRPGEAAEVEALAIRGIGFAAQGLTESADESILKASVSDGEGLQNQRFRLCAGWVGLLQGDFQTAYRELEAALPTQARGGSLRISLWAQAWLARVQFVLGDWDAALRGALDGIRRAEQAGIELMLPLLEWTAREVQLWRGEAPRQSWWQFAGRGQVGGYVSMQVPARMIRGVEAKVKGDHQGALAALMPLIEIDPWRTDRASFWHWQSELIHALIEANRIDEAAALSTNFSHNSANAPRYIRATVLASQARVAAAQKKIDQAEEFYAEALRLTSLDGISTYHGRYLFAYGQMLRRVGRRREAADRLVSAREFFAGVQASKMVERCNQELRATGMLQYRPDEKSVDVGEAYGAESAARVKLTPQERSVSELVVQGLTNKETARRLFLAEKTVQYHLTRIYSKFGIRSRTELASVFISIEGTGQEHDGPEDSNSGEEM